MKVLVVGSGGREHDGSFFLRRLTRLPMNMLINDY